MKEIRRRDAENPAPTARALQISFIPSTARGGFGLRLASSGEACAADHVRATVWATRRMPISAEDFFAAKLAYETDPADLAAERATGSGPIVIDTRSRAAWDQGRIPGAVHVPNAELADRAAEVLPAKDAEVVVHCWGPGCNGSTRAALTLSRLGCTAVRELIGGFEYWAREGFAVVTSEGRTRRVPDPLTAPAPAP